MCEQETSAGEVPRPERLLKEYEICEKFAAETAGQYWRITALFLPIAFGSLALVIQVNLADMEPFTQKITAILIALTGVVFMFMLYFWSIAVLRALWYQHIAYYRAREIEFDLGLGKNLYINALDNWSLLSEQDKRRYQKVYDALSQVWTKGSPRRVRYFVPLMAGVGIISWMMVSILKILEVRAW